MDRIDGRGPVSGRPPREFRSPPKLEGGRLRPPPIPRADPLPVLLALGWTLLVWLNWFHANWFGSNPLTAGQVGEALGEWVAFSPGAAILAWARHLVLIALLAVIGLAGFGVGRPFGRWLAGRGVSTSGETPQAVLAIALGLLRVADSQHLAIPAPQASVDVVPAPAAGANDAE